MQHILVRKHTAKWLCDAPSSEAFINKRIQDSCNTLDPASSPSSCMLPLRSSCKKKLVANMLFMSHGYYIRPFPVASVNVSSKSEYLNTLQRIFYT